MSFVQKLFLKTGDGTLKTLREVIARNETDEKWISSFREKAVAANSALNRLLEEFRQTPSDALATEILKLGAKSEAEKELLNRLSQLAAPATRAMIRERTIP